MDGTEQKQKNFVRYEYKEIVAENSRASFLLDGYESLGWEIDEKMMSLGIEEKASGSNKIAIRIRRDRNLVNKMELTRLQRNFESCMEQIDTLENSKTFTALICALTIGLIGTAFMAGATFAVTADPPHFVLCIILAIPAFFGWVLPYFIYKKVAEKQTLKVTPLIEEKYDEIYEICKKGSKLLY